MKMQCTVTVTLQTPQLVDAKKTNMLKIVCDKYFVKDGILACETREYNAMQDVIKVKTTGVPIVLIAKYEALYENIDEKSSDSRPSKKAVGRGSDKDKDEEDAEE